jgi:hypothetical protein
MPRSTSKSYWAGQAGVSLAETPKSRLPAWLSEGLGEHTHRAGEDVVRQAAIFKRMSAPGRNARST